MVPNIDHDLDVDGDVILTLQSPNEPFAVWDDELEPWELPRSPPPVLDDDLMQRFRQIDVAWQDETKDEPPQSFGWGGFQEDRPPSEPIDEPDVTEAPETPVDLPSPSAEEIPDLSDVSETERPGQTGSEENQVIRNEVSQVKFRLSSRHLISASPIFRAMLTGPWAENASRAQSSYTISATDWDEDALKLLMDIIHGNSSSVPRFIDLELLAKIAVLVDYYKCYNVVKFYSDTWIEGLGIETESPHYSREFVLMLFVSCVFFQRDKFRDLSLTAMRLNQGPFRSLGLPFPGRVIEHIEESRLDAVGRLLDGFHNLLQYFSTRDLCLFECNAILVGSLYRQMFAQGILIPRPEHPFHGFSVEDAIQMARDIPIPKKHVCSDRPWSTPRCSIRDFLDPLTDEVTNSLQGLNLENYVDNPWIKTTCSRLVAP